MTTIIKSVTVFNLYIIAGPIYILTILPSSLTLNKRTPELNAVLKQVNKFKLNIIEASFVKSNLEEIFRKITTTNASS